LLKKGGIVMKATITIILVAAFGGVFSNLIDIARRLQMDTATLPSSTYFLGCLIWAVLGAAVALLWSEKNLKKVFYLGIGLPSLLQLNIGNLTQMQSADQQASVASHFSVLAPSTYAQPPSLNIQGRTITFTKTERSPDSDGYRVIFFTPDEKPQTVISIDFRNRTMAVPDDAACLAVEYRGTQSAERLLLPMQSQATTNVEIDVQRRGWSGFLQSIGMRSASKYALHIRRI
jgi:hypothetical protein